MALGLGAGLERVPLLAVALLEPGGSAASLPPAPEQPANNSPVVKVPQRRRTVRARPEHRAYEDFAATRRVLRPAGPQLAVVCGQDVHGRPDDAEPHRWLLYAQT
ncbi:hypothetical protein [Streptomyces mirabilis]|uniref:hypothetical protein n=1 Tax=Streptomyces mirabilis TaxID=68239 RepID=UPI00332702E0